jgi:ATP-binding cassette subfamily D (ALD) long-chain fatty acid import protein
MPICRDQPAHANHSISISSSVKRLVLPFCSLPIHVAVVHLRRSPTMAGQPSALTQVYSTRSLKRLVQNVTTLYISNRTRVSRGVYLALFLIVTNRIRNTIKEQKAAAARVAEARRRGPSTGPKGKSDAAGKKKVELNREFFRNLGKLLRICVPGWKSTEVRLLGSYSVFLVLRTLISLYVAELDGRLVSSLVKGKGKDFAKGLVWWMIVAVPATFTNSMVSSVVVYPC